MGTLRRKTIGSPRWIGRIAAARLRSDDERERLLAELNAAGFPTAGVPAHAPPTEPHTLLVWARAEDHAAHFFVVPDDELDDALDEALEAANGLSFANGYDCSLFQLGAALRVLAATGLVPLEELLDRVEEALVDHQEGDPDAGHLPGKDELEALHGRLASYAAGSVGGDEAPRPEALDARIARAVAIGDRHP